MEDQTTSRPRSGTCPAKPSKPTQVNCLCSLALFGVWGRRLATAVTQAAAVASPALKRMVTRMCGDSANI